VLGFGAIDDPTHSEPGTTFMANTVAPVQWDRLRHDALCQRSGIILGPATASADEPMLTFTATNTPNGDIIITVGKACALAEVYDLAVLVSGACLNDIPGVVFTRMNGD
jgi:hypothetical protein